jgi:hypothetical protein
MRQSDHPLKDPCPPDYRSPDTLYAKLEALNHYARAKIFSEAVDKLLSDDGDSGGGGGGWYRSEVGIFQWLKERDLTWIDRDAADPLKTNLGGGSNNTNVSQDPDPEIRYSTSYYPTIQSLDAIPSTSITNWSSLYQNLRTGMSDKLTNEDNNTPMYELNCLLDRDPDGLPSWWSQCEFFRRRKDTYEAHMAASARHRMDKIDQRPKGDGFVVRQLLMEKWAKDPMFADCYPIPGTLCKTLAQAQAKARRTAKSAGSEFDHAPAYYKEHGSKDGLIFIKALFCDPPGQTEDIVSFEVWIEKNPSINHELWSRDGDDPDEDFYTRAAQQGRRSKERRDGNTENDNYNDDGERDGDDDLIMEL